ncbi:hypothetical protein K0M31_015320 [Melipona bicolor]|uniref:Uncharacterized protein n=1 Tax=Melipona bicolor TaxID=60889 RepID=A0AA40KFC5_9HYME|nr:hypothetical protein K0M31_015320 [Melipona bicolor]
MKNAKVIGIAKRNRKSKIEWKSLSEGRTQERVLEIVRPCLKLNKRGLLVVINRRPNVDGLNHE